MNELIGRVFSFEKTTFPASGELFNKLTTHGQFPKALMISCADSRVVPEQILQAQPGDLFVCRNAGNMVPSYGTQLGGVSATVEYAVAALGVRDIIVCGHSDCGAMKALSNPVGLERMPNVKAWLDHGAAAEHIVSTCKGHLQDKERVRAITLENIIAQIAHLRTHPSVASAIARGEMALHGWFVDIHAGQVLGLDGESGHFVPLREDSPLPVAMPASRRIADETLIAEAAE
ncbi:MULTISPECIES: carbonic anhydrase [unclassified Novosphingobium]|uniref:carbonic anhydrase n=1 Tax=unclassified Novosphingobium TaxID=2644732 RepID=UPI00086D7053|nr:MULTISPECIES: carbonic anhydrase [unclassified Novosphingobium]MBN9144070.1 carbonic anhydrase [Novosphingobium sp.]MDR6708599.1 carbonic anhydrase [Novosphingobium sp. 1748]NKJ01330.1 carbonic anhydrase [Novosphingobium sp. SG707]ODU81803.1 MAG: carbonic anhydrase [Novosphingobium sp. SCN 63-17]OJX95095.1 MAG: carbonic anhydrase [Novosphingobium sp. 63-713]